jgi:hypothetical protein
MTIHEIVNYEQKDRFLLLLCALVSVPLSTTVMGPVFAAYIRSYSGRKLVLVGKISDSRAAILALISR